VAHAAGRNSTPSGTSPVVTRRHSAISSLRASATIIVVLRAPLGPSVRVRYHCASALSFWNIKKRHANWISPRRTRALPALARPLAHSLDHLVGAGEQRRRDFESESLGGFEIDYQVEFRRLLHRQVCRLGALQNFLHV